ADGESSAVDPETDAAALADDVVTDRRVERTRETVETGGVDAVTERVLEVVAREEYDRVLGDDARVDLGAFESAVGEQTRRRLDAS
ncbi:MAG: hypothetical protein ABEH83_07605, partial [Halobacterium sp.]